MGKGSAPTNGSAPAKGPAPESNPGDRAGVLIARNDRLAMVRKTYGGEVFHNFPGGRLEPGESPRAAAVREAFEELGLEVRLERLVATWESVGGWDGRHWYYAATPVGGVFGRGMGSDMLAGEERGGSPRDPSGSPRTPGGSPHTPSGGSAATPDGCTAVWLDPARLNREDVRPKELAQAVAAMAAASSTVPGGLEGLLRSPAPALRLKEPARR